MHTHRTYALAALLPATAACHSAPALPPGLPPALTTPTREVSARIGLLDAYSALVAICPPEHLHGDTCAVCPFDEDATGPVRLAEMRPGRYFEDGSTSYLVMFDGCTLEPVVFEAYDRENMKPDHDYTLTMLAEVDGKLELMSHRERIDLNACVFPKTLDGRDAIVCVDAYEDYGESITHVVQLEPSDIAMDDNELTMLISDVEHCQTTGRYYSNHKFYGMSLSDKNRDGLQEVIIEATLEEGFLPAPHDTYCDAVNAGHDFEGTTARFHTFRQDEDGYFYGEEPE